MIEDGKRYLVITKDFLVVQDNINYKAFYGKCSFVSLNDNEDKKFLMIGSKESNNKIFLCIDQVQFLFRSDFKPVPYYYGTNCRQDLIQDIWEVI